MANIGETNDCYPRDCSRCKDIATCEEKKLFNTVQRCASCGSPFVVERLFLKQPIHGCRKYHGW